MYEPPISSWGYTLVSLRALQDITNFWNRMLVPSIWSKEFVKDNEPNDMVALGHYVHSAVGKPYPCWGYGRERNQSGGCDEVMSYGHPVVLDRLQKSDIVAKYTPGTLMLNAEGLATFSYGVLDKNYQADTQALIDLGPAFNRATRTGSKLLRFIRGVPHMKLLTGKWVKLWGYILEDALEQCVTKHLGLLESDTTCFCTTFCCDVCNESDLLMPPSKDDRLAHPLGIADPQKKALYSDNYPLVDPN